MKLGADAVNLSLGSPAGFTEYGDEDEEETDGYLTYSGVYTRAEEAGINVMIAAGNETSSTYYNPSGTQLTLAQYPAEGGCQCGFRGQRGLLQKSHSAGRRLPVCLR